MVVRLANTWTLILIWKHANALFLRSFFYMELTWKEYYTFIAHVNLGSESLEMRNIS